MSIVYLNGQFIQQEKATVSILDRGFLFGDGVYEAIPVYQGYIFGLHPHLDRLAESLSAIKMRPPLSPQQWEDVLYELLVLNGKQKSDQSIYVQVTRGAQPVRNHSIPADIEPTVFALCFPPKNKSIEALSCGFSAITTEDPRRTDCHIKAVCLLPNVLAFHNAEQAGCNEVIFIRNGKALEGSSSNLFIVKNNVIKTPPLGIHILSGVTRSIILALAKENQHACEEVDISEKMLREADEIWLTGSFKEIHPITKLDGKSVGTGRVGAAWQRMIQWYHGYRDALARAHEHESKNVEQPEDRL